MKQEEGKIASVWSITSSVVRRLQPKKGVLEEKAYLANLKNSIGKPLSQSSGIWPLLFEIMPEQYLGKFGKPTREELVVVNALQLYALQQQGITESVALDCDGNAKIRDIGSSLAALRDREDSRSVDQRFNALITAEDYEELIYHLRQLMKLLKTKTKKTKLARVHYGKLAGDLYWFLRGREERIRLAWAQSYYGTKVETGEDHDNE